MVVSYVGPCAFIEEYSMLVIGDLHIGTDQDLSETGAFAPDISISNITKTLTAVIRKTKPDIIVVLGDIAIHFGKMPDRQRQNITTIIHRLKNSCKKLVLLKGNHDAYIAQYFKDTKTPFAEQYIYNEYFFCHGHEIPEIPDSCTTIFIGHEHPAISMTNSIRTEKFKCILKGVWNSNSESKDTNKNSTNNKTLYVLPSINQTTIGTDITKEQLQSPFLANVALDTLEVFVVEDMEVYAFGTLNTIQKTMES